MNGTISPISLPPSDYPNQEDYAGLIFKLTDQTRWLHDAFLHSNLLEAQKFSGDLFQTSYDLLKLASTLMIERNNRDTIERNKEAQIRRDEVRAEDRKTHQQRQQEFLKAVQDRKIDGFYERHSGVIEGKDLGDGKNIDPAKGD